MPITGETTSDEVSSPMRSYTCRDEYSSDDGCVYVMCVLRRQLALYSQRELHPVNSTGPVSPAHFACSEFPMDTT